MDVEIRLLSAISKPYSFDGKSGTSHRLRFLAGSDVFVAKSSPEQVESVQKLVGTDCKARVKFSSVQDRIDVTVLSVKGAK